MIGFDYHPDNDETPATTRKLPVTVQWNKDCWEVMQGGFPACEYDTIEDAISDARELAGIYGAQFIAPDDQSAVSIECCWNVDTEFPRETVEVWRVIEDGAIVESFDTEEEAISHAQAYCVRTGARFDGVTE